MGKAVVHLVEDDPVVRAMLTRLLESGGYRVDQYATGRDFLEIADTLIDGCILLDINSSTTAIQQRIRTFKL